MCKKVQKSAQEYERKGDRVQEHRIADMRRAPIPPIILHEYKKIRFAEIAIRNRLILTGPFLVVGGEQERNGQPRRKKSGSKLPHSRWSFLQCQVYQWIGESQGELCGKYVSSELPSI